MTLGDYLAVADTLAGPRPGIGRAVYVAALVEWWRRRGCWGVG